MFYLCKWKQRILVSQQHSKTQYMCCLRLPYMFWLSLLFRKSLVAVTCYVLDKRCIRRGTFRYLLRKLFSNLPCDSSLVRYFNSEFGKVKHWQTKLVEPKNSVQNENFGKTSADICGLISEILSPNTGMYEKSKVLRKSGGVIFCCCL